MIWTHRNVIHKILFDILHPDFSYMIEDCESEVMMIAVEHAHELLSHTAPTGWFIVTTRNVAHAARRKEIKRIQNDTSAEGVDLTIAEDPLENILYKEWIKNGVVDQLLSRLTPREREVYDLAFVEGKSTKDIAGQLHIRESTVRNIRKNIMDKIKRDVMEHRFETF
ncbi:MAG: sigma-70 family RNA polymerase sigma factor [Clostridia bacterium]|nr:sigma-70 family RNA polymerase sigma factor [Clostridia bacterium]